MKKIIVIQHSLIMLELPTKTIKVGKAIDQTDRWLRPKFHRLTGFVADDRRDMRWGQANDAPFNLMPAPSTLLVFRAVNFHYFVSRIIDEIRVKYIDFFSDLQVLSDYFY